MSNRTIAGRTEPLVAPGGADGTVTLATNRGYFLRAVGWLSDDTGRQQRIRIISKVGSTQLRVRFIPEDLSSRTAYPTYGFADASAFLPLNLATLNQDLQVVEVDDIDPQGLSDGLIKIQDGVFVTAEPGVDYVVPGSDPLEVQVICSAGDLPGDIMYFASYDGQYHVSKVDITQAIKMTGVGVLISKSTLTTARLKTSGLVTGVYSGLTPGGKYFTGFDSRPVLNSPAPTIPNARIFVQKIGIALATDAMYLRISPEAVTRIL